MLVRVGQFKYNNWQTNAVNCFRVREIFARVARASSLRIYLTAHMYQFITSKSGNKVFTNKSLFTAYRFQEIGHTANERVYRLVFTVFAKEEMDGKSYRAKNNLKFDLSCIYNGLRCQILSNPL